MTSDYAFRPIAGFPERCNASVELVRKLGTQLANVLDLGFIDPQSGEVFRWRFNCALKPVAGQALRPNQTIVPLRPNAALAFTE